MAAYAALVSLLNNIEQIINHPLLSTSLDKKQIESLGEKLDCLLDFVVSYSSHGGVVEDMESQIASAAHGAEDVIESHIVDLIQAESTPSSSFLINLQKQIEDMDYIKAKVVKVKEETKFIEDQQPTYPTPAAISSRPLAMSKSTVVGFDEELIQLMDVLTGQQSCRQIISIVGMGGMGKSTLARTVFENSLILQHFDVRAWSVISQEYNVREILLELLSFQGKVTNGSVDELGEQLYKSLSGRRYLIVLDDMWNIEVWDNIKFFLPDNGNRSRVVLTTRQSNVVNYCGSTCFRMKFLDKDKSWNLFCQKVFGQEDCPSYIVEIGKTIVEKCRGLPLSIVVIGGLLRKSYRTKGCWQNVAENINSILNSRENEQCLDILYLSYRHLPAHLKSCFLYMGSFQEDEEIGVSKILKLWVAEGFIRGNGNQILEEIADGYLEDLVDRNLILVCTHRPNGKIRSCRIHDLVRDLCLMVAKTEKFFCVASMNGVPQGIDRERRVIFHGVFWGNRQKAFKALQSASLARSLICEEFEEPIKFRLLRVLNKARHWNTEAKFQNVNLRYFAYQFWSFQSLRLPSSVSLIWNLQSVIIKGTVVAPLEIWKMPQLRHLKCSEIFLPDPPPLSEKEGESFFLMNLQTLTTVVNFRWSEEACMRIPNIKKLSVFYCNKNKGSDDCLYYNLHNLVRLHKLESLNIWCSITFSISICEVKNMIPSSVHKLSLKGCRLHWEDLTMIGSLPQLEVLKLEDNSVVGDEWSPVEGGFLRLKFLKINYCDLGSLNVDSSHFPVLEKLVLCYLWNLYEIPWGIGEIPMLQLIRLEFCNPQAVASAIKIKEEQESLGNDGLQIQLLMHLHQRQQFTKRMQVAGFSINNVQLLDIHRHKLF